MFIKLLSTQIPTFWEVIKFADVKIHGDEFESSDLQSYLNELLCALLNDKAQCFVKLSDERKLLALWITRVRVDRITAEKTISLQSLYSWKVFDDETIQSSFNLLKEFAKQEKCKRIFFESGNKRIWQMAEFLGFKENLRKFVFDVEEG